MPLRTIVSSLSSFLFFVSRFVSRVWYSRQRSLSTPLMREENPPIMPSIVFTANKRFLLKPGSIVATASSDGSARPLMRLLSWAQSVPQSAERRVHKTNSKLLRSVS